MTGGHASDQDVIDNGVDRIGNSIRAMQM